MTANKLSNDAQKSSLRETLDSLQFLRSLYMQNRGFALQRGIDDPAPEQNAAIAFKGRLTATKVTDQERNTPLAQSRCPDAPRKSIDTGGEVNTKYPPVQNKSPDRCPDAPRKFIDTGGEVNIKYPPDNAGCVGQVQQQAARAKTKLSTITLNGKKACPPSGLPTVGSDIAVTRDTVAEVVNSHIDLPGKRLSTDAAKCMAKRGGAWGVNLHYKEPQPLYRSDDVIDKIMAKFDRPEPYNYPEDNGAKSSGALRGNNIISDDELTIEVKGTKYTLFERLPAKKPENPNDYERYSGKPE